MLADCVVLWEEVGDVKEFSLLKNEKIWGLLMFKRSQGSQKSLAEKQKSQVEKKWKASLSANSFYSSIFTWREEETNEWKIGSCRIPARGRTLSSEHISLFSS